MRKAVMYGGGNIGRGFIGMLFSQSGYEVIFVDVSKAVVEELNRTHCYPVRILSGENYRDVEVAPISAVDGNEREQAVQAIAEADVMATAVGVPILPYIVPNLAEGIRRRMAQNNRPLNILICENLMDADKYLSGLIQEQLNEEEKAWFAENVGLVETSIGRMVPVQTEEMKAGNPLRVCTEEYHYLPVDGAAFRGSVPEIKNMVPYTPFDYYMKRKLYLHNMGHALCAYMGIYAGKEYIWEAIGEPCICLLVQNAMEESAFALSRKYHKELSELFWHIQDLLHRFTNAALQDTCARVGKDPKRKLSGTDRLIGAASFCMEQGIVPACVCVGAAGALYEYQRECGEEQTIEKARLLLKEISGLEPEGILTGYILSFYEQLCRGHTLEALVKTAGVWKAEALKEIV